ncbi:hypothetical protein O181_001355 [Austropuccinia psidii MF-1]|uniref:Uncharacterized protein n=1 Tax=Austropuccinia psidii MF-1 TaxID=1389203 RepID=A0A9Q3BAU4_9BASI|nr:hypothetical protein [Austropuccinia psidii MF-1]
MKKKTSYNCRAPQNYSHRFSNETKNIYAISKFPKEGNQTEDSDSNGEDDPMEEHQVEYQQETHVEIQIIKQDSVLPQVPLKAHPGFTNIPSDTQQGYGKQPWHRNQDDMVYKKLSKPVYHLKSSAFLNISQKITCRIIFPFRKTTSFPKKTQNSILYQVR